MLSSGNPADASNLLSVKGFLQTKQRLLSDQEHILWSTHQSLTQSQSHESELQRRMSELQAVQQTTAQKVVPCYLSVPCSVYVSVCLPPGSVCLFYMSVLQDAALQEFPLHTSLSQCFAIELVLLMQKLH